MVFQLENKIIILHDFNLKLKLYNLTNFFKKRISKSINKRLIFISTKEKKKINANIDKIQIYWGNRLNLELLKKLRKLKWIHFGSSGVDYILKKEINKRKINFTRSNKIITETVVSSIIFNIFFLGRGMMPIIRNKYYDRKNFESNFENISDVFGEKVLIFGTGDISKFLKKKLNLLKINSKIVKIKSKSKIIKNKKIISKIQNAKFIINCLPLNEGTINFFDKKIFTFFDNCFFINIGRGDTVNIKDLKYYLKKNKIISASLDVFTKKDYVSPYRPLKYDSELWNNKKILITPHIASISSNYWLKQSNLFISLLKSKKSIF